MSVLLSGRWVSSYLWTSDPLPHFVYSDKPWRQIGVGKMITCPVRFLSCGNFSWLAVCCSTCRSFCMNTEYPRDIERQLVPNVKQLRLEERHSTWKLSTYYQVFWLPNFLKLFLSAAWDFTRQVYYSHPVYGGVTVVKRYHTCSA